MLALVPLLAPVAVALAGAVACLILLYIVDMWFRSWAYDDGYNDPGLIARVLKWGAGRLRTYVRKLEKRVVSRLSNAVAARSPLVVRALNNGTEIVERFGTTFSDLPAQTYRALYAFRHVTLPAYVTARLEPVTSRLNTAFALAQGANDTLTAVSVEIADGLRALPWGVPLGLSDRVETWMVTYKRLWDQVWDRLTPRVNTLYDTLVPQLRRDVDSLLRGAAGNIGTRLQALTLRVEAIEDAIAGELRPLLDDAAGRILELERDVRDRINIRLDSLQLAVDTLAAEIFTGVGTGLTLLTERVVALEREAFELIPLRLDTLEAGLAQLRTELEQGIATGLELFRERIDALEQAVTVTIPQRLDGITGRLEVIEAEVFGTVGGGIELVIGRIEWLEDQVTNNLAPRLSALENILAPAALAALILQTMRTAAPNLFCNPVTEVTSRLCRTDEQFLSDLLNGALLFALVLDPRIIARSGQAVTEGMAGVWRETVIR